MRCDREPGSKFASSSDAKQHNGLRPNFNASCTNQSNFHQFPGQLHECQVPRSRIVSRCNSPCDMAIDNCIAADFILQY